MVFITSEVFAENKIYKNKIKTKLFCFMDKDYGSK